MFGLPGPGRIFWSSLPRCSRLVSRCLPTWSALAFLSVPMCPGPPASSLSERQRQNRLWKFQIAPPGLSATYPAWSRPYCADLRRCCCCANPFQPSVSVLLQSSGFTSALRALALSIFFCRRLLRRFCHLLRRPSSLLPCLLRRCTLACPKNCAPRFRRKPWGGVGLLDWLPSNAPVLARPVKAKQAGSRLACRAG